MIGSLNQAMGHVLSDGRALLAEIRPLLARINEAGNQYDQQLYTDLSEFRDRVLTFVRATLNPALLTTQGQTGQEPSRRE